MILLNDENDLLCNVCRKNQFDISFMCSMQSQHRNIQVDSRMIVLNNDVLVNIFGARHCSADLATNQIASQISPQVLSMVPPISLIDDEVHFPYIDIHCYCKIYRVTFQIYYICIYVYNVINFTSFSFISFCFFQALNA